MNTESIQDAERTRASVVRLVSTAKPAGGSVEAKDERCSRRKGTGPAEHAGLILPDPYYSVLEMLFGDVIGCGKTVEEIQTASEDVDAMQFLRSGLTLVTRGMPVPSSEPSPGVVASTCAMARALLAELTGKYGTLYERDFADAANAFYATIPSDLSAMNACDPGWLDSEANSERVLMFVEANFAALWALCGIFYVCERDCRGEECALTEADVWALVELFYSATMHASGTLIEIQSEWEADDAFKRHPELRDWKPGEPMPESVLEARRAAGSPVQRAKLLAGG